MSKYVVINSDGTNSFYDSTINTTIPSGALSMSDTDYDTFFSNQGSYVFKNVSGVATLTALTTVYFATNYGTTITTATSNTATPTGATKFTSSPTTAELTSAFPSTAGARPYTVTANSVAADTVAVCGITLTATASTTSNTNYAVGSTIADTVANIVAALNANAKFNGLYTATASSTTFTITELLAGDGNTPGTAVCSGTIAITSGTATTSVQGYTTATKLASLASVDSTYQKYSQQYDRAYASVQTNPELSDTEKTTNQTSILAAKKSLTTWRNTERSSIING